MTARDWARDFDHLDPTFVEDPYAVYESLRGHCPVAHTDQYGGVHVLTRWADIDEVVHDPARFSSRRTIVNAVPTSHPGLPLPPLNFDPPIHTELRRAMLPFFNPHNTARWAPEIEAICTRRLDALAGRNTCDGASDYAQAVPSEITAIMLGVDAAEGDRFRHWIHDLIEVGPGDVDLLRRTTRAMTDYLADLLERTRSARADRRGTTVDPGRNIVEFLLDVASSDDRFDDTAIVNTLFLVLIAGIDTTWSAIGFALEHLGRNPDDRRRLVAEPGLVPTATEEFLRAYAPVSMARVAEIDTEVAGCPVRAGEWVLMAFPAANRDPAAFERADEVLIDRAENRHATFGLGVHRCIGSNLARLEINIALARWLERFPEFRLAEGASVSYAAGQVRGPRRVPLVLG